MGLSMVNTKVLHHDDGVAGFRLRVGQRFDNQTVETAKAFNHDSSHEYLYSFARRHSGAKMTVIDCSIARKS